LMLEDTDEGGRFCNICAHEWNERRTDVATPCELPGSRTANPRTREPAAVDHYRLQNPVTLSILPSGAKVNTLVPRLCSRPAAPLTIQSAIAVP